MKRHEMLKVGLFVGLAVLIAHLMANQDTIIIEHLTKGPASLASLQKDTQELQSELDTLKKEVADMKAQAQQGAAAASAARLQIGAVKQSASSPP